MAQIDDVLKSDLTKGLAIGIGLAVLAPLALAALSGVGRPLSRAGVKAGILLYEKGRETAAELGEVFDDLVAEARAELRGSRLAEEQPAGEGAPETAGQGAEGAAVSGERAG
jgi:hypothetical protein